MMPEIVHVAPPPKTEGRVLRLRGYTMRYTDYRAFY